MDAIFNFFFFSLLLCGSNAHIAECTGQLTLRPPSLFEQYCCIPSNSGKKFKLRQNNHINYILCPTTVPTSCSRYSSSCNAILQVFPTAPSGYYTIQAPNGSISVYCDMEGSKCDGKGGWMRIGYLNMSEPGATCPPGLMRHQYNNIDHDVCGRSNSNKFNHTFFSTQGIHYNKVCGQLRGYQYRAPDAFTYNSNNIESCYVDGVSITYGSSPRKHIWTYANGLTSDNVPFLQNCCPCNANNTLAPVYKPNFIGDDYYCESAIPPYVSGNTQRWQSVLYVNDTLWDGQQCDGNEGPCCTNTKMPWFIQTFNVTTNEDIELRVCCNEDYPDEDTLLDIIELYVS